VVLGKGWRARFWIKPALATTLTALADLLFYGPGAGSTLGAFGLALALATLVTQPQIQRDRRAGLAWLTGVAAALAMLDQPTLIGFAFFGVATAMAVLSGRTVAQAGAWRWCKRLTFLVGAGLIGPALDLIELHDLRRRRRLAPQMRLLPILALPILGGGLFLALFAAANPLIGDVFARLTLPNLDFHRGLFWLAVVTGLWMILRPRFMRPKPMIVQTRPVVDLPGVTPLSVGLSLTLFNLLFAVENGLDIAFLWSGAALPHSVTLASYAHRGAYTLIATALLAGLFVLVTLRPGSATAQQPWLRRLVVLWVAQNLVLVASSVLRTVDYIQFFSLTRLRIAALVWMGLVAIGLVLICWRLLRGKSGAWLVNANILAACVALAGCSLADLGAVAANWNVDHAQEVGGGGAILDLWYLKRLGPDALAPLSRLALHPLPSAYHDQIAWLRWRALDDLRRQQSTWRTWTERGQRQLDQAVAILPATAPTARFRSGDRTTDGELKPVLTPLPATPLAMPAKTG
jgi:hypothetical protein